MLKNSLVAVLLVLFSGLATAQPTTQYDVKITNITPAQAFTPQLVVTHPGGTHLFTLGAPASAELEALAEGGMTGPLADSVANVSYDQQTSEGLLMPGDTTILAIVGHPGRGHISLAAMLLPTNDTFVGLNSVRLPRSGSATYMLRAYDAGTEYNDQHCDHIPGPTCGGEAISEASDTDEGFVHIGNGFQEMGDDALSPHPYDWGSAVAKVVITRIAK